MVPPPALDGYPNNTDKENFLFKRGYHRSYPRLLIYDNKIMINPFPNRTGSQTNTKNINNLYFLEQSNLVTNEKTFVDETPGALYINSFNDDNRSISFTSNVNPDYFMQMELEDTNEEFKFCQGDSIDCPRSLLNVDEAGNVGIGHAEGVDLLAKLDVDGLIQLKDQFLLKLVVFLMKI